MTGYPRPANDNDAPADVDRAQLRAIAALRAKADRYASLSRRLRTYGASLVPAKREE